jgi:hypothetical protein
MTKKTWCGKERRPEKHRPRLTDKQYRAVAEYFTNGFNKREALLSAGYSRTVAEGNPQQVFTAECVVAEVRRRHGLKDKQAELNKDWLVSQFMKLATASATLSRYKRVADDGTLYWDFTGATEEHLALVHGLAVEFYTDSSGDEKRDIKKFKINETDPIQVLTALARIEGLFADRLKLEGDDGVVEALQAGRNRTKKGNPEDDTA